MKLTNVSDAVEPRQTRPSESRVQLPAGRPDSQPTMPGESYDIVRTMLTLQCSPVLSLQNGFSGESLGRSPLVCVSAGLHHGRRLRGGQVPQRVSASSLRPGSGVQSTCELIILKKKSFRFRQRPG